MTAERTVRSTLATHAQAPLQYARTRTIAAMESDRQERNETMATICRLMAATPTAKCTQAGPAPALVLINAQKYAETVLISTNTLVTTGTISTKTVALLTVRFTPGSNAAEEEQDQGTTASKFCRTRRTSGGTAETMATRTTATAVMNMEGSSRDTPAMKAGPTCRTGAGLTAETASGSARRRAMTATITTATAEAPHVL